MNSAPLLLSLLILAAHLAIGSAQADPAPVVPPVTLPQLQVMPLRDAGGLPDAGKLGLNLQMTQGLVKYLTDHAQGRYTVVMVNHPSNTPRSAHRHGRHQQGSAATLGPRMTLEGELSHVLPATGDTTGGPYFCILRLFQAGMSSNAPRHLTHEWTALAHTYLDLTSNLGHHPHVDSEGLLGELAHRVITDVINPASSTAVPVNVGDDPISVQVLDSNFVALKKALP